MIDTKLTDGSAYNKKTVQLLNTVRKVWHNAFNVNDNIS